MGGSLEAEIRKLQSYYWSDADPDGRGFVPLADAYRRHGDSMEALRILRDGLRRHPELVSGHVVRGWIYVEQGDFSDAEAAFRAVLEVDPHNVSALRGLGEILADRGALDEALEVFRTLLPLDPLDVDFPERVEALAEAAEALAAEETGAPPAEAPAPPRPWEDSEGVAEELNWDAAALQADESRPSASEGPTPLPAPGTAWEGPVLAPPGREDALVTRTMGDILLRQGLLDEAEDVYQRLLSQDPENPVLRQKLEEVQARQRGEHRPAADPTGVAGERIPERIVPVQESGVDGVVPIEELAPDLMVSIEDLSPDVIVPVQALAPDSSAEDPTLDAFEAWLDELP
ncbi:MAG: tetratricopeptide repeat protein [Longimicrobiales bacterium]